MTLSPEVLSGLRERLSLATEGDRELDADIDVAFFGGETVWKQATGTMDSYPTTRRASTAHIGGFVRDHVPDYTASIDAALALVPRLLPGWTIARMSQGDNKLWTVELREGFLTSYGRVVIEPSSRGFQGTTLPLAILLALLTALQENTK